MAACSFFSFSETRLFNFRQKWNIAYLFALMKSFYLNLLNLLWFARWTRRMYQLKWTVAYHILILLFHMKYLKLSGENLSCILFFNYRRNAVNCWWYIQFDFMFFFFSFWHDSWIISIITMRSYLSRCYIFTRLEKCWSDRESRFSVFYTERETLCYIVFVHRGGVGQAIKLYLLVFFFFFFTSKCTVFTEIWEEGMSP